MSAQPAKLGVWGDAVRAALTGDRRELVELLRHHNKPPDDVLEFLAWLLDERKNGRPPLPAKFKEYHTSARNPALYDAVLDLQLQRANWNAPANIPLLGANARGKFPYRERLAAVAKTWGVDENALQNKDRRSRRRR